MAAIYVDAVMEEIGKLMISGRLLHKGFAAVEWLLV